MEKNRWVFWCQLTPLEWKSENFEKLTESAKHIIEKKRAKKLTKRKKKNLGKR